MAEARAEAGASQLRYGLGLVGIAIVCLALAAAPVPGLFQFAVFAAGGVFLALGVVWLAALLWQEQRARRMEQHLADLVESDPTCAVLCDRTHRVRATSAVASDCLGARRGASFPVIMQDVFAGAEDAMRRIELGAKASGAASEEIPYRSGKCSIRLRSLPGGWSLWRLVMLDQSDRDVPVIRVGPDDEILSMNARARALFGREAAELGELVADLPLTPGKVHPMQGEPERKLQVMRSDAEDGGAELVVNEVEAGDQVDPVGSFETLPVPLLRLAPDGTILSANGEARELLDLRANEVSNVARSMEGLGRPLADWLSEAAEGRGLNRSEFLRLTRPDREVFVQVTLNRTEDDGRPVLIAVLNDATELKTLEAQFVQSQKMQAIGQLAGGVAHDFNNLLTAISGHCDLLLLRHDQGDPDYSDLVQINQNANRAAALVGQLLAFSRKQTMRPEVLDLRDTLADLTHLLNRLVGEKVRLVLRHDPILPSIRADRRQLEQVMMNLVVNARDAMRDSGELMIETERRILREPLRRDRALVPPGTYVAVTVSDEGIGIPSDKLQKVFEPFFTTKRTGEGTGLGLSTVYGIVKQSGGFIFVDSVLGRGSVFTLLFPAHVGAREEEVAPEEPPAKAPVTAPSEGVVLLVEDEAPVRSFAARALRLRSYEVIEAETGEEALELLAREDTKVDVFVTDVVMPGMDGPTWVREAQKTRPEARVVFISGYAENVFSAGGDEVPNSVFLPKPFSLSELADTVAMHLTA
ncbi:ATP-binding response regulator [Allosediminivita pacifica]|uniref:histidine kinase n=2 Tax=Allosediminivita pacifica TaxID=1267769 RepID=A0A2T6B2M8_9RHOB|nr:ATP-binding protein [Allosediminivita pacifica]PTX50314.1 two-component system cell cycle sensor histidine kinase/response regulator CckA [Allosediminivita pacifica]